VGQVKTHCTRYGRCLLEVKLEGTLANLGYLKPRVFRDNFPLPLFQEMSRYENHIETGLGTKNGLFEVYPDYM
jgi:hypothetical protein